MTICLVTLPLSCTILSQRRLQIEIKKMIRAFENAITRQLVSAPVIELDRQIGGCIHAWKIILYAGVAQKK